MNFQKIFQNTLAVTHSTQQIYSLSSFPVILYFGIESIQHSQSQPLNIIHLHHLLYWIHPHAHTFPSALQLLPHESSMLYSFSHLSIFSGKGLCIALPLWLIDSFSLAKCYWLKYARSVVQLLQSCTSSAQIPLILLTSTPLFTSHSIINNHRWFILKTKGLFLTV